MRFYISLFTLVVLAGLVSAGFAQDSATGSGTELSTADTPAFPYVAEITGDDVYLRSGPGTNFYQCGKLNKGDRIKVLGRQFSWSRIVPPAGSFSWISMQYVKPDADEPSSGTVTGDNVRVYAGSDIVKPLYSTSLQGKLGKGEKVKLLGEQLDEYYKIAPPAFAFLWVTTNFTKPAPVPVVVEPTPATTPKPVVAVETATEPKDANEAPATAAATAPEVTTPTTPLEKYYALKKKMEAERAKPIAQQDYKELKQGFSEIANNKDAGNAARFAEFVVKQIDAFQTALAVGKEVELQDEQLEKINAGIDKARVTRLAEIESMGRYAVIGQFQNYATFGPGHYRIVDESGKMVCYALPTGTAAQTDLSSLIGKKVGLVGVIEPHQPTKQAMVRFSQAVRLE